MVCEGCSCASEAHRGVEGWERRLARRHENLEGSRRNPAKTQTFHNDPCEDDKVSHLPRLHVSIKAAERATLLHSDLPAYISVRMHSRMHQYACHGRVCKCRRRGTREIRLIAFRHQPDSPSGLEAGGCLNRCLTPSLRRAVDDETACLQPHSTQGAADCSPRHPLELRDNVSRYF